MAKKRPKVRGRRKIRRVLDEFKEGDLRSSAGQRVTNPKQALAIALSEQRRADKESRKRRRG